jgi:phospholipid/cholesterol/gamma-HCH transport system ATP-binding protein
MLFQGGALFDSTFPVWQNVAFRLLRGSLKPKTKRAIAVEKLRRVGLGSDVADRLPAELSGGMQSASALPALLRNRKLSFRRTDHGTRSDHGGCYQ